MKKKETTANGRFRREFTPEINNLDRICLTFFHNNMFLTLSETEDKNDETDGKVNR